MHRLALCSLVGVLVAPRAALAQLRGVYPTGMNATGSGVTPAPGLTYSNLFIFNSRDELLGARGERLDTGQQAVMLNLNTLAWVSPGLAWLGGGRYSATATLLFSTSSLASDTRGELGGGGGFGDSFYQPLILGWDNRWLAARVAYGILAPTGRFEPGAADNVGSGYWTHAPSAGLTIHPAGDRSTALSAFGMYEIHGAQEGTGLHPGQTWNLDYSLTHTLEALRDLHVQLGVVGYSQWQTTDKHGPGVSAEDARDRYQVHAVGFATSLVLPTRRASLGFKYFDEYGARSTVQGHSIQIAGAIGL